MSLIVIGFVILGITNSLESHVASSFSSHVVWRPHVNLMQINPTFEPPPPSPSISLLFSLLSWREKRNELDRSEFVIPSLFLYFGLGFRFRRFIFTLSFCYPNYIRSFFSSVYIEVSTRLSYFILYIFMFRMVSFKISVQLFKIWIFSIDYNVIKLVREKIVSFLYPSTPCNITSPIEYVFMSLWWVNLLFVRCKGWSCSCCEFCFCIWFSFCISFCFGWWFSFCFDLWVSLSMFCLFVFCWLRCNCIKYWFCSFVVCSLIYWLWLVSVWPLVSGCNYFWSVLVFCHYFGWYCFFCVCV